MKISFKLPVFVLGILLLFAGSTVKAQDDQVSLQQFYDELSPYGNWIQDPQYGYVWRPDVNQSDFRPYYTNGRWVMTQYGNTWVSNYDWGWAPFHYGRWITNRYNQWVWIPDTTWGPAWVDWRSGDGYYGWAPMSPIISININFGRRYVRPDFYWNFIPQGQIYYSNYPRYRSYNNVRIINRTKIINNTYVYNNRTYYTGPRPEEIRRATRQDVPVYQVARNNRIEQQGIDRNTVNLYSPRPQRGAEQSVNPAPRNVGSVSDRGNDRVERNAAPAPNRIGNTMENRGNERVIERETAPDRQARPERGSNVPPSQPVQERTQVQAPRQDRQMQATPPAQRTQPVERAQPQRQERPQVQPQARPQQQERPARTEQSRGGSSGRESNSGGGRPERGGR